MIEVTGDLWQYPADVRVITTNGTVKKNGECVMGRGCALEAKQRWPAIAKLLGDRIQRHGNVVQFLDPYNVFSFPVKHHWRETADLDLIRRSAEKLQRVLLSGSTCVMPRPGCGNGGLVWCWKPSLCSPTDHHCEGVKHVLEPILDDRFHVITWGRK